MIGTVEVRVSAGHPEMPVRPIAVVQGSAATIGVLDVPKVRCGVTVSSVSVSVENAAGTVETVAATLKGGVWCATIPASHFDSPGTVSYGLTVTASGTVEDGTTATSWIIGRGDVDVLSADGVPVPGETMQNLHYRATAPASPTVGDFASVGGAWCVYDGSRWRPVATEIDLSDVTMDMDASQNGINGVLAKIVRRCGGTVIGSAAMSAVFALASLGLFSMDVRTAKFGSLSRTNDVVVSVSGGGAGGVDTNAVNALIASATNSITADDVGAIPDNGHVHLKSNGGSTGAYFEIDGDSSNGGTLIVNGGGWGGGLISVMDGSELPASILKGGKEVATVDQVEQLNNTVSTWQTYWDGDDVRVTVTNYYGAAGLPSLYLEQKMPTNDAHATPWFKTIWDERTRWNLFLPAFASLTNDVAQNKADRAWGVYDSSTGAYSPDGLLQLSQEQIMIASGLSYQKTVTAGGSAIWVLKATNPTMLSGQTENGFFRIEDGDGNALFEIVKGDKRVVGATATGITMDDMSMLITYSVESAEHPTLEVCTDLRANAWATETDTTAATVSWSGSSGNWVATVTPVGARPQLFAKASYEAGGETCIRNSAPISGGILCTDGVHKVRPVYNNGAITWTVVQ